MGTETEHQDRTAVMRLAHLPDAVADATDGLADTIERAADQPLADVEALVRRGLGRLDDSTSAERKVWVAARSRRRLYEIADRLRIKRGWIGSILLAGLYHDRPEDP